MSRLTIAIPSKGRLKEQTEAWLAGIGHPLRQIGGERGYTAEIDGLDAEVRLLSAREIAQGLIEGSLHFGVTGEDLLNDLVARSGRGFPRAETARLRPGRCRRRGPAGLVRCGHDGRP